MPDLVIKRAEIGPPIPWAHGRRRRVRPRDHERTASALGDIRIHDGVITEVGPHLAVDRADEVVDAGGCGVIPGLHDHHVHLYAAAAARTSLRVGPPQVRDAKQFEAALRQADRSLPPDRWLRGVGYHDSVAGRLDRRMLDAIVPGRPVRIQHRSGVEWVLNSAALEQLPRAELDRDGVERDEEGVPTGRLIRMDQWLASVLPAAALDLRAVSATAAAAGVTGFTDATPLATAEACERLFTAKRTGEIVQRLTLMTAPGLGSAGGAGDRERCEPDSSAIPVRTATASGVRLGPVKIVLDDALLPSLEELGGWVANAHRQRRPVAVHCVTRVQAALTVAALVAVGSVEGDRIEHGSLLSRDLAVTLERLGVTVVTNPGFVYERGDTYWHELEPAELDDLYRCASLQAAGVAVAAGTDAPFGPADPWVAIRAASTRMTAGGRLLGTDERLTPWAALSLFFGTAEAPATPRSLSAGQPGDLCVLKVPLAEALRALDSAVVGVTILGGQVVSSAW